MWVSSDSALGFGASVLMSFGSGRPLAVRAWVHFPLPGGAVGVDSPRSGQELLAETVEGLYHGFGGSRVRTFVPVLVENEARDVLAGRRAAASY